MIHVAVGIVQQSGRFLVARRAEHLHQGGLWEFPGGKIEDGESVLEALCREFAEELDLTVLEARPLLTVEHDYGDKAVLLDVWRINDFRGEARGMEGQPIRWVTSEELAQLPFPAANQPIVTALTTALA